MDDILTLGRSKELSKARASHMEAALQKPIKTEPVNLVTKERTLEKKKNRRHGRNSERAGGAEAHSPMKEIAQPRGKDVQPAADRTILREYADQPQLKDPAGNQQ